MTFSPFHSGAKDEGEEADGEDVDGDANHQYAEDVPRFARQLPPFPRSTNDVTW